jgi:low affinity Fe/Cu permease
VSYLALEDQLLTILVNYGLAGVVIYVFYALFKNELRSLKRAIERLDERVRELSEKIEKLVTILEKGSTE